MSDRTIIEAAVERILYSIVKLLMDCGVTFPHFTQIAKRVFVKVAAMRLEEDAKVEEERIKGIRAREARQELQKTRKADIESGAFSEEDIEAAVAEEVSKVRVNTRRMVSSMRNSMLTGIPRKDIPALLAERIEDKGDDEWYRHRCGKVLNDWWNSAEYTDNQGQPLELVESDEIAAEVGDAVSFEALVREGGVHLSHHALLDELLSTNAVEMLEDGRIKVLSKRYERMGVSPETLTQIADWIFNLGESINGKVRGIDAQVENGEVFSIDVDIENAGILGNRLRRSVKQMLSSSAKQIKQNEVKGGTQKVTVRIGVGAYVFRGDEMKDSEYFAKSLSEGKQASNE